MQYFIDSATQEPYVFEDNVTVQQNADGTYSFSFQSGNSPSMAPSGRVLAWTPVFTKIRTPSTLQPCTEAQATSAAQTLESAPAHK
jgi:hypothetical protein